MLEGKFVLIHIIKLYSCQIFLCFYKLYKSWGFPCGSAGKECTCNVGDLGLIPVGKIPWRRELLPIPVFWPGEFHGLYSPWGHKELDTTEHLSLSLHFHGVYTMITFPFQRNFLFFLYLITVLFSMNFNNSILN